METERVEYEERYLLDEESFDRIVQFLEHNASAKRNDRKSSFYFEEHHNHTGQNVYVNSSSTGVLLKVKDGSVNQSGHTRELEVKVAAEDLGSLLESLEVIIGSYERAEQFRTNYTYRGVEIALKYTETWGFHVELDATATVFPEERERFVASMQELIREIHEELGVPSTLEDTERFLADYRVTSKGRGEYEPAEYERLESSLVKAFHRGATPRVQHMDEVTLRWLAAQRPAALNGVPSDELAAVVGFLGAAPDVTAPVEWYHSAAQAEGIHGLRHGLRVGLLAYAYAGMAGSTPLEQGAAFVAGLLHDCGRYHDHSDPGHGARITAVWETQAEAMLASLGLSELHGMQGRVGAAVAGHDVPLSELGPSAMQDSVAQALRVADALDRFRLPLARKWLDPKRLGVQPPPAFVAVAFDLMIRTEELALEGIEVTSLRNAALNELAAQYRQAQGQELEHSNRHRSDPGDARCV